jgi:hypothetical protein
VVHGGTRILGGSGRYTGTWSGVVLIVLLNSVLSIMQMPAARPPGDLRRRHRRHALGLRPQRAHNVLRLAASMKELTDG